MVKLWIELYVSRHDEIKSHSLTKLSQVSKFINTIYTADKSNIRPAGRTQRKEDIDLLFFFQNVSMDLSRYTAICISVYQNDTDCKGHLLK